MTASVVGASLFLFPDRLAVGNVLSHLLEHSHSLHCQFLSEGNRSSYVCDDISPKIERKDLSFFVVQTIVENKRESLDWIKIFLTPYCS